MFSAIKKLVDRVKKFNQEKALNEILTTPSLESQIIDLNQKQLYEKGVQADGSSTGQYSPITISHYKPLAAAEGRDGRTDHVTLKDTGHLYDSMQVQAVPDGITIVADDENGVFEKMKVEQALGLTPESISDIIPEIRTELIDKVKSALYGKS
jgi:hypothetical protein